MEKAGIIQKYKVATYLNGIEDIKFGKNAHAYVDLKIASEIPYSVGEDPFENKIQFYVTNLKGEYFEDDETELEEVRKRKIFNFLDNKIVFLTPNVKHSDDQSVSFYQGVQPIVYKANEGFDPNANGNLVMIPKFSKTNVVSAIQSVIDFKKALLTKDVVGKLVQPWSDDKNDFPEAIIFEDNNRLFMFSGITGQDINESGISFEIDEEDFKECEILESDEMWYEAQYVLDDIIFTDKNTLDTEIYESQKIDVSLSMELKNKHVLEEDLIDNLRNEVFNEGLYYSDSDLINFHTAMKSSGLVILSGLSGTGKSRLVSAYAASLGTSENNVRFIPVRPYWADDSDLIGYADTVNSVYRPGDSGLVDTLVEAENNPDELYIVIFDEMNLAKVEHYFSQFLSVLEMPEGKRSINLYNHELQPRMYNRDKYHSTVRIGNNILFVGTVNTDESTFQFSDKVLDRANVISLKMVPFYKINEDEQYTNKETTLTQAITVTQFNSLKRCSNENSLSLAEKRMLWEIHESLNSVDKNIGIGWRILKQIDEYLCDLPKSDSLTRSQAFDLQLNQRVWTKVRGSEEQLKELLGAYSEKNEFKSGKLIEILKNYSNVSDFKMSIESIKNKAKDLKLYGFTI